MQKRLTSLIEASINTLTGYWISVFLGLLVYPIYNVRFLIRELSGITAIFTLTSILRSYGIRRLFNFAHTKGWWK